MSQAYPKVRDNEFQQIHKNFQNLKKQSILEQQFYISQNNSQNLSQSFLQNDSVHSINISVDHENLENWLNEEKQEDKKILIICLGGTISMVESEEGLVVKKGAMQELMKKYYHFYDPEFVAEQKTSEEWYITPKSIYGRRTWYQYYEIDEPIDSSNMTAEHYILIAKIVEENYEKYDGFLLIHGTDTMSYTASMLSFLFENLSKTIIITGAMIPLSAQENDAYNNLVCSLLIVGHFTIPEVTIFMNDRLIRGNRAKKMSSEGLDAFDSPMVSPLIQIDNTYQGNLQVNNKLIYDNTRDKMPFRAHQQLCEDIIVIQINPVLNLRSIKMQLNDPDLKGVILETYGAGNIPSNKPEFLKILKDAVERGVIIVNISQCYYSSVSPIYQTGTVLQKIGVLFGHDMTLETVLCKMQYLLSKEEFSNEQIKQKLSESIRGEVTSLIKDDLETETKRKKDEKETQIKQQYQLRPSLAFPDSKSRTLSKASTQVIQNSNQNNMNKSHDGIKRNSEDIRQLDQELDDDITILISKLQQSQNNISMEKKLQQNGKKIKKKNRNNNNNNNSSNSNLSDIQINENKSNFNDTSMNNNFDSESSISSGKSFKGMSPIKKKGSFLDQQKQIGTLLLNQNGKLQQQQFNNNNDISDTSINFEDDNNNSIYINGQKNKKVSKDNEEDDQIIHELNEEHYHHQD